MASNTSEEPIVQAEDRPQGDKKDSRNPSPTPDQDNGDKQDIQTSPNNGKADEKSTEKIKDSSKSQSPPPLPTEEAPPLPNEPTPGQAEDDGWDAMWDDSLQAYYFYNRFTGVSQWENPRVPDASQQQQPGPPGVDSHQDQNGEGTGQAHQKKAPVRGGYDPAVHGDYDPNAWYAQQNEEDTSALPTSADPNYIYTATGTFNRFTGKWQAGVTPENFNDENKSRRQLNAYFDVDAAANSHEGRSLKAERSGKKLTKKELKAFKDKRRERKEEKRRAWLRD